jgi:hypothetical protein
MRVSIAQHIYQFKGSIQKIHRLCTITENIEKVFAFLISRSVKIVGLINQADSSGPFFYIISFNVVI